MTADPADAAEVAWLWDALSRINYELGSMRAHRDFIKDEDLKRRVTLGLNQLCRANDLNDVLYHERKRRGA